jgi:hypothetical protein
MWIKNGDQNEIQNADQNENQNKIGPCSKCADGETFRKQLQVISKGKGCIVKWLSQL